MKTLAELAKYFEKKQLRLKTGKAVCYREANRGASTPVVVVHGLTGTHYSMLQMAGVWAKRGDHVIAIDLPGHGHSDEIEISTFDDIASWLDDVIRSLLPCGDFILVGNSFGCSVCVVYARTFGLRGNSKMILTAPIPAIQPLFQKIERLTANVNDKIARRLYYCNPFIEPLRISVLLGSKKNNLFRARVSESIKSEGYLVKHRYAFLQLMPANYQARPLETPLAPDVARRTVSFSGSRDRIAPRDVHARMESLLGDAKRVSVIDGCGHLVHIEAIKKVTEAINIAINK